MPSVPYMNRSAPFWDWVASLEQEGANHPFFSPHRNANGRHGQEAEPEHHDGSSSFPSAFGPWGWGWTNPNSAGWDMPHRGRDDPATNNDSDKDDEKTINEDKEKAKNFVNGEGPAGRGSDNDGPGCGRGHWGSRRGRHCGGSYERGGPGSHHWEGEHRGPPGPPPHGSPRYHGGPHGGRWGRRGGRGPWGRGPFNPLASLAALFDPEQARDNGDGDDNNEDFSPDADIFDTLSSYIIHVSLPGAKKEDVGVNWDAEKSELSIAGVIYRPADEEMLKTLAMSDRKVGAFERKIRLGTRASPANVDVTQISAKLEDGVLRVEVPKLGDNGFVEVTKVDVE